MAIGRTLLVGLLLLSLAACADSDVPPPAVREATPAPSPVASVAAPLPSPPTVRVDRMTAASAAQAGPGAYRYDVQVPQLVGVEPHGQALDSEIRDTLQRDVNDFLAAAQSAQSPTDLTCASQAVRLTGKLAVLRVDCTSSQAGVARPVTVTHTFNCDLAGARILTLQDLFSAGSAYLDVLSGAARSQFPPHATPAAGRSVADATAPVAANFRAFLLGPTALVIVFPDFLTAPATAAPPEVSVSYDDLERYFAPRITDLLTG